MCSRYLPTHITSTPHFQLSCVSNCINLATVRYPATHQVTSMANITSPTVTTTEPDAKPSSPLHHDRAGLIAGFVTAALPILVIAFWIIYHFRFPLWRAPYRAADQADLEAVRKWNEDLARGLQKRRESPEHVVGTMNEQAVGQIPARRDTDAGIGVVRDSAHEAVPESWRDKTWWQACKSGALFRPWS